MPEIYFEKSERALDDAKNLSSNNRNESACSRAYYAMFNAVRAALLILGLPGTASKSHDGFIRLFGEHVILGDHLDKKFGRSLNDVERLRQIADYIGDPPSAEDAPLPLRRLKPL